VLMCFNRGPSLVSATLDTPLSPPSTSDELFCCTCLQNHLQTSSQTPQKSYAKFWNFRTTFENPPLCPHNAYVWVKEGLQKFVDCVILIFLLLAYVYKFNIIIRSKQTNITKAESYIYIKRNFVLLENFKYMCIVYKTNLL
jgi:hypothetical protein